MNSTRFLRGMNGLRDVTTDVNYPAASSPITDVWGNAITSIANAAGNYATAQQTNQGIATLSNVAMIGIAAWVAVKIFGK